MGLWRMWLKKFTIISAVLAFSLFCGCASDTPEERQSGTVTVCVVTRYGSTEISADYCEYSSWTEMLDGEFDGSSPERGKVVWRGDYVTSIGNLRPDDANKIVLYLNGVYSQYFATYCEYAAGYTLSFVERGAEFPV